MKKNLTRVLVSGIALTVVSVVIFLAQTIAYFSDTTAAPQNFLKTGRAEIELIEQTLPDGATEPVPFEGPIRIMPGTRVSKIVTVQNTGSIDMYIRIKVEKNITLSSEHSQQTPDTALAAFTVDSTYWEQIGDYYYYRTPLAPREVTEPLFREVRFDPSMGNIYTNSTIEFDIRAESTQVLENGTGYADARW